MKANAKKDTLRTITTHYLDIDPQALWGEFNYSGVGCAYGRYGIEAFLETRAIVES
jgi:hypothetical protein